MRACLSVLSNLASVLLALLTVQAAAQESLSGNATALDGDSLSFGDRQVRLFGIDAPEYTQNCSRGGETWSCGEAAKAQLADLVQGKRVDCQGVEVDAYGRIVARCSVGYVDLNRTMVERGWAMAYRAFTTDYVPAENAAKSAKLGIWASEFTPPWDYRTAQRPAEPQPKRRYAPAPTRAPSFSGCVIKGNRSRRGEWIYHVPGMPYYNATRAEEMFCSEEEAQAAGYRRAIVRP